MSELAIIGLGAFLAAIVTSSAGFAFAIIVTGIWIYVLPPAEIVFLASICATLIHITSVVRLRRDVQYRFLWPFLIGGVVGVPLGVLALKSVEPALFRRAFAAFMVAYGLYAAFQPRLPRVHVSQRTARFIDVGIGGLSGVMGGFAMLHGTLTTVWCSLRGWDKRVARGVYQPYILFSSTLVLCLVGLNVNFDHDRLQRALLACLPALALGFVIGIRLFDRLSDTQFTRIVAALVLVSGVVLLVQ